MTAQAGAYASKSTLAGTSKKVAAASKLGSAQTSESKLKGLEIYPYYCRSLSLTLGKWCPLRARDVHALEEADDFAGQDVYFYRNHMVKYVKLTGVIVAVEEFFGRLVLTLDDGSGVNIDAICAIPPKPDIPLLDAGAGAIGGAKPDSVVAASIMPLSKPQQLISPDGPNLTNLDVGLVVKIKGGIGLYRQLRVVRLKSIVILGDTNAEVNCWTDVVKFRKEVLNSPWVVSPEEQERCRIEEDREAKWKIEEEAKRKKEELRRQLREKAKELQEKQMKREGETENTMGRENREKRKTPRGRVEEALDPKNRPSKAARRRAAGKYDALGI